MSENKKNENDRQSGFKKSKINVVFKCFTFEEFPYNILI